VVADPEICESSKSLFGLTRFLRIEDKAENVDLRGKKGF